MSRLRPAIVLAVVAAATVTADARPKKKKPPRPEAPVGEKVRIETDPGGANVYLGDKESPPVGQTPLDLTLPEGEQVVILELDGYVDRFENVVVVDSDMTQTFAYTLDPAKATLVVKAEHGTAVPGGTHVMVDGVDQGELPAELEVEVGAHEVQVVAPGHEPYDEWVEVDGGEEHVVTVTAATLGARVSHGGGKKAGRAAPMGEASAGVEIGYRHFSYDSPRSANARPYDASNTVQLMIDAELYPWRRFVANKVLDRLSITVGGGYAPPIEAHDDTGTVIDAYWRSQHAGLRFLVPIGSRVAIDPDVGWTHTIYTFLMSGAPVAEAPDVDYHAIEIGARVLGYAGPVQMWLGAWNRLMLSGGALADRFRGAKVDGFDARVGAAAWFLGNHLQAKVEADYAHYGWTFDPMPGDTFDADGGSDSIYGVTLSVGGAY